MTFSDTLAAQEVDVDQQTGLARLALVHLDQAIQLGLTRDALLREARLEERQVQDPDSRIPLAAIARLWRCVTKHVSDPAVGLRLGAGVRVRQLGLVGYTMAFSSTVGSALRRLGHYSRIVSDALVVALEPEGEATWLRIGVQPALQAFRPAADARLAAVLAACREIAAAPIAPLMVQLPYRRPTDVKDYETFFAAPLEFGALATAFLLRNEDLARGVAVADPTLTGYLDHLAEQALSALGSERTVRDRVRRVLWSELTEAVPSLDRVASTLAVSARTLQRQLREEGTSFAGVLTELRREMAPALLRDGRLAVSEVAFLLGYEDPSAFQRAFRRWFGQSPRAFRSG
jgi:AraC-like DNA-binding protein